MARFYHALYLAIIAVLAWVIVARQQPQPPAAIAQAFQAELIAKTENFGHVTWLGKPMWQSVLDLQTVQETIYEVKPELLIECGTYKGGSSFFVVSVNSRRSLSVEPDQILRLRRGRSELSQHGRHLTAVVGRVVDDVLQHV